MNLIPRPDWAPKYGAWRQVRLTWLRNGQPRPYADSYYEFVLTIEGGTSSTRDGYDLPSGYFVDESDVKVLARILGKTWTWETPHLSGYLAEMECLEDDQPNSSWRFLVIQPWTD